MTFGQARRIGLIIGPFIALLIVAGRVAHAYALRRRRRLIALASEQRFDVIDHKIRVQECHAVDVANALLTIDEIYPKQVRELTERVSGLVEFRLDQLIVGIEHGSQLVLRGGGEKSPIGVAFFPRVALHHVR